MAPKTKLAELGVVPIATWYEVARGSWARPRGASAAQERAGLRSCRVCCDVRACGLTMAYEKEWVAFGSVLTAAKASMLDCAAGCLGTEIPC